MLDLLLTLAADEMAVYGAELKEPRETSMAHGAPSSDSRQGEAGSTTTVVMRLLRRLTAWRPRGGSAAR